MDPIKIVHTSEVTKDGAYRPLDPYMVGEEEAQIITIRALKTFQRLLDNAPLWQRYEFSARAENALRRHHLTTAKHVQDMFDSGKVMRLPGVGFKIRQEWQEALNDLNNLPSVP